MLRRVRFTPGGPNEAWSLDFVADQLDEGRRVRALTLVDAVTPESRALEGGRSLRGAHVVVALSRIGAQRGTPKGLFWDNGSAFCSRKVDLWADQHRVRIEVSRPGKPTDHASVKPFTGTIREECLNAHGFESLQEAKGLIEAWRQEYNESHPHRAFYDRTPEELASPVAAYRNSKGMNGAGG